MPYYNAVLDALHARNMTAANESNAQLSQLTHLLTHPGGKSQTRAAARLFANIDLGPPRLPLADVDPANVTAMAAALRAAGFLPHEATNFARALPLK